MSFHRSVLYLVIVGLLAAGTLLLTESFARQRSPFGQLDLLADVRHELVTHYVDEPDQEKMLEAAIEGMISSLGDPHTSFLTEDDLESFRRTVSGKFSGIGAEVQYDPDLQRIRIVTPLEDSPAWRAGVMAGDVVMEIEGQDTEGMPLSEAIGLLLGEPNTEVTIKVRHESGKEEAITITRQVIEIQTVRGFRRDAEQHFVYMLDADRGVGYVRITQFNGTTADELRKAIEVLKKTNARGLIVDLRFNPGGLLESAVEISDMFLEGGKRIVSVDGRAVQEEAYNASSEMIVPSDWPVVIIVNEGSASASEIVSGALKDNERALVVGTRSFGKGSVQQVKQLERGESALKLTNAYYYLPSGRNIHKKADAEEWGVDPSPGSYVGMTADEIREMLELRREKDRIMADNGNGLPASVTPLWIEQNLKDPQLAAALESLRQKLDNGDWPEVGVDVAEAVRLQEKRDQLTAQRDLLRDRLDEVEKELADLDEMPSEGREADDSDNPDSEAGDDAKSDALDNAADVLQDTVKP